MGIPMLPAKCAGRMGEQMIKSMTGFGRCEICEDCLLYTSYYSEELSHRIYAASDAFLMPSLFEPCGLSQLMSLRYGTVPIVRETGGLKDTVWPYNEFEGTGTGFSFTNYNAHEMLATIRYAEQIYYDKKRERCV